MHLRTSIFFRVVLLRIPYHLLSEYPPGTAGKWMNPHHGMIEIPKIDSATTPAARLLHVRIHALTHTRDKSNSPIRNLKRPTFTVSASPVVTLSLASPNASTQPRRPSRRWRPAPAAARRSHVSCSERDGTGVGIRVLGGWVRGAVSLALTAFRFGWVGLSGERAHEPRCS
ncbi:unnamed protein product [Diplocarpon coronariae]